MIVRLVKMSFKPELCDAFHELFREVQPRISECEGCLHVELLRDINDQTIFFTLSHWQSPENLEQYRQSALFETTWAKTKAMFRDKPQAWSVEQL